MPELSIAVEHAGVGIHVLLVAGDLDEDGSARLARVIDHIAGLRHAIVDLGNVRTFCDSAFDALLDDDRVTVTGLAAHQPLLPGWVASALTTLRTARDVDAALRLLPVDPARAALPRAAHRGRAGRVRGAAPPLREACVAGTTATPV